MMSQRYLANPAMVLVLGLALAATLTFSLACTSDPLLFPDQPFVVLMDEAGVGGLAGPEGAVIDASRELSSQTGLAVLSGVPGGNGAPSSGRPGIYLTIPAEIGRTASGRQIKVTVVARRPPKAIGDRYFAVAYSTNEVGTSAWRGFQLTDALVPYSFIYDVPTMGSDGGLDFVGILPDLDGGGGVVEIAAIGVELIADPLPATAFYYLAVERVPLPPVESRRGALAKVGDLLLYAAQKGRLYVIGEPGGSVREVDLAIPLLHENAQLVGFTSSNVSIYDVAAEPSASGVLGHYDLYASYLGIDDEEQCIFLTLSKALVAVSGAELSVVAGWQDVFRSEPCLSLASIWDLNNETGGRIDFDAAGIVLTIGVSLGPNAQDDNRDYGKVVRLDRTTFERHTISKGNRNPQGLFIDSDGTIFETEHGPQGGDELNVIEDGKNYGWPVVTYGTNYGRRYWCRSELAAVGGCEKDHPPESQGRHLTFEQPIYAFVPSVGISQIIKVTRDEQFPIWQGDFLIASLSANSLYRLHLNEGRVIVVEPILFRRSRLRDLVELDDGRIAILTDERELLIVSNADKGVAAMPPARD